MLTVGHEEEVEGMKLIVGGCSQGKLDYVLAGSILTDFYVCDGELPDEEQVKEAIEAGKIVIINHFHMWMRTSIKEGKTPEKEILEFVGNNSNSIVISDEIGNGIVPMDGFEREYRERTGRILVKLAQQADEVVRVICGIGQKIK